MRFRFGVSLVAVALVVGSVAAGCSQETADDNSEGGEDDITVVTENRTITATADPATSSAQMDLKTRYKGATLEKMADLIKDQDLSFWKGLKRPKTLKIGTDSLTIEAGGAQLFTEVSRDDNAKSVRAYMPFAESGLASHSGVNFDLQYTFTQTPTSFTLTLSNPKVIETKFLGLDIVAEKKLNFSFTAQKVSDGVVVIIHETVQTKRGDAPKLLGVVTATADLLDQKFGRPSPAQ